VYNHFVSKKDRERADSLLRHPQSKLLFLQIYNDHKVEFLLPSKDQLLLVSFMKSYVDEFLKQKEEGAVVSDKTCELLVLHVLHSLVELFQTQFGKEEVLIH